MLKIYKNYYRYNGKDEITGEPLEQENGGCFIMSREVTPNTKYTVYYGENYSKNSFNTKGVIYYDKDGKYLSSFNNIYGLSDFTTPEDCYEIRIGMVGKVYDFLISTIDIICEGETLREPLKEPEINIYNAKEELLNSKYKNLIPNLSEYIVIKPEMFGAKGDGISDDYVPLKNFVKYLNENTDKKMVALLTKDANYRIDRYHGDGGFLPEVNQLIIKLVNDLYFLGNDSCITSRGNFIRHEGSNFGGYERGVESTVYIGFSQCNNLTIKDFERYGESELTSDLGVIPAENSQNRGFGIGGCQGTLIDNVHVHHFIEDAFAIGEDELNINGTWVKHIGCDTIIRNCLFEKCSRNALTVGCVKNVEFQNCTFRLAGFNEGKVRAYAPALSVDIEPDRSKKDGFEDQPRDIRFVDCIFEGSRGGLLAIVHNWILDVKCIRCKFIDEDTKKVYSIFNGGTGLEMEECEFDIKHKFTTVGIQPQTMNNCTVYYNQKDLISVGMIQTGTKYLNQYGGEYKEPTIIEEFTDFELYKAGYRYNGTDTTTGEPLEQPWNYQNNIFKASVKENTEYDVVVNDGYKIPMKGFAFYGGGKYIDSISSMYPIGSFTTPAECDEIRSGLFITEEEFAKYEAKIKQTTIIDNNKPEVEEPVVDNTEEIKEIQGQIADLQSQINDIDAQIESLENEKTDLISQIKELNNKLEELEK